MSLDVYHLLYKSVGQAFYVEKPMVHWQRTYAIKVALLCREWGKRYYKYEKQFNRIKIMPMDFFVKDKNVSAIQRVDRVYRFKWEKMFAVFLSGASDEEINQCLGGLIGRAYSLGEHTIEEIFADAYLPLARDCEKALEDAQQGRVSEDAYRRKYEAVTRVEILLAEYFYRHAWQGAPEIPSQLDNVQWRPCVEDIFERRGLSGYFWLYELGVCDNPIPIAPKFNGFKDREERHIEVISLLAQCGIKEGDFVVDAGCGRNSDSLIFAAAMGAEALGCDIDREALAEAQAYAEKILLRADLLPSQQQRLRQIYERIRWVCGDIMQVSLPRPATCVVMEGFIDVGTGISCCYGMSLPNYSKTQIQEFLARGYQLLGSQGWMLVSIFLNPGSNDYYHEYFLGCINRFAKSQVGLTRLPVDVDVPRAHSSRGSCRGFENSTMVVISKNPVEYKHIRGRQQ